MESKVKVGIIRCQQTEDMCPGTTCLKVATKGKIAFADYGECEIVGFVSCGGCPGKRAIPRAKMLVDRGAQVLALATCISKGTPIGFPCPHTEQMRAAIQKAIGPDIVLLENTH
ncbi:putative metal-binding protein [Dysgonomonadaceae bacterium PH5-43]|nr:putative metal-binding protein [Dysgonomonadaceae bacterium PH5-43]